MKNFTLGQDNDSDSNALYDENGKLIRAWQNGDDIYRVIKDILSSIGIGLSYKEITVDGDFPQSI